MVMTWIFTGMLLLSVLASLYTGQGSALAAGIMQGAQSGVTLAISLAGSMCLWTGVGHLMERLNITQNLSKGFQPLLKRLFPAVKKDKTAAGYLSANICANLLGLGNAATPMGIQAARRLALNSPKGVAGDDLCRLIVLNTASIQLIPANVAAVRTGLGCATPFDILPAVWITSLASASLGLTAAWLMGKVWKE